ncbi:MAG: hypothetical protein AMS27_00145 [Bacteroides sp. SM23_62_1]|nr:MAG: hypothetical protein AMS27_00145 [Bacteroides sp. SM23_62_1]
MSLRQISIRSRFFTLTVSSIILWLIIGLSLFSFLGTFREYYALSERLNELSINSKQLSGSITGLLLYDQYTNAFYETGRSGHMDDFDRIYLETINLVQELKTERFVQKNELLHQKLELFLDNLSKTENTFQILVSKLRERGYSNWGLHGHVISLLEDLFQILENANRPVLQAELEQLEIFIEGYFHNPTHSLAKKLTDKLQEIYSLIDSELVVSQIVAGTSVKQRVNNNNNNLSQYIQNTIIIDREIGLSQFEGIRGQIRTFSNIVSEDASSLNAMFKQDLISASRNIGIGLFIVILLSASILITYTIFLSISIKDPLRRLNSFIKALVLGRLPGEISDEGNDEIYEINMMLGNFTGNLKEKARFAGEIGRKQEDVTLPLLSEEDILGNALIEMGKYLQAARNEDQKHQAESEKRRWINEGLAKIEEILRIHSNDLNILADKVIQNLVKYLNASIGALYLTNTDDENILELAAAFAFDRKKYLTDTVRLGEGLVGTCAIEKQKIFLTEIPEEYLRITSGLGDTKPRCLLLVPLKLEDQLLGVIEIASLNILQEHEVLFIEIISESIASAISSVRITMRTSLLLEQSQQQARDMAEQEEKMRQHVEELQVTQEESARRESEISGILNAIHNSSLVAEYNMNEELININDKFLLLLETHKDHIIGKKYHEILGISRHTETYKEFWQLLREGKTLFKVEKIKLFTGNEIWLQQTYAPIPDKDGVPFKVLNIAIDITETKIQQESLEKQSGEIKRANIEMQSFSDAVDQALIKCVYSPAGQILEVNENFEKVTGFSRREMIGKNNRTFLQRTEREQFEKIWNDIMKDKPYSGVIRRTKPTGEEVWIMSTFTPVKDENGAIFKVYYLGQDITERKLKYQLLEEANKEIDRLKRIVDEK